MISSTDMPLSRYEPASKKNGKARLAVDWTDFPMVYSSLSYPPASVGVSERSFGVNPCWLASQKDRTKKERRERTGSWRLHNRLLAYQAILKSSSSSILILDLTYYYKKYSLSKWKTIDYLPKKIESPTYEKRSQIELNQVTLQRHNDSRVGISPPSEPDVKVSPHPALCRGISTHCFP